MDFSAEDVEGAGKKKIPQRRENVDIEKIERAASLCTNVLQRGRSGGGTNTMDIPLKLYCVFILTLK